jgi:AcrR family transcriptional regulator
MSTMSPKTANPALRMALLETAARLIAEEGSPGLSLRRLAAEVGTSTMAIYTHFGGMTELRQAVRREGFARLAGHLAQGGTTADPVTDLGMLGWRYYLNATTNPHLYRAMFMEHDDTCEQDIGMGTFQTLVDGVDRCIRAGRFHQADPVDLAMQLWSSSHGIVALQLAALITADQALATSAAINANLLIAFGDDPAAAAKSMKTVGRRARLDLDAAPTGQSASASA